MLNEACDCACKSSAALDWITLAGVVLMLSVLVVPIALEYWIDWKSGRL